MSSVPTSPARSFAIFVVFLASVASAGLNPVSAQAADGTVTLTGRVVDGPTGDPLTGAAVYAHSYSPDGEWTEASTETDEEGRYELTLPSGKAEVRVEAKGYQSHHADVPLEADYTHDVKLTPVPPKDAVVTGRVLDAAGNPIEGVTVTLTTGYHHYDYAEPTADAPSDATDDGGSGESVESAGSTEPAPADARMIREPDQYQWEQTRTDADGRFSFDAYSGPIRLGFEKRGYATEWRDEDARAGDNDVGEVALLRVPDANAVITGRVVDAETGLPVAGASVSASNQAWSRYNWTTTDESGTFSFRTLPGYTRIDVYAHRSYGVETEASTRDVAIGAPVPPSVGPSRSYYSYATTLVLEEGENVVEARLTPKPEPSVILQGYVVDVDAETGVAGAWVSVRNEDTGEWGSAQTDEFGSYKIAVRPGHLVIDAGADGYFQGVAMATASGAGTLRVDVDVVKGESRYAPCEDCYGDYAVAEDGASAPSMMKGDERALAEGAPASAADGDDASSATNAASGTSGDATYQGGGGGLGPYTAASADEPDGGLAPGSGAGAVPAGGAILAAFAAAGAAAVLAIGRGRR